MAWSPSPSEFAPRYVVTLRLVEGSDPCAPALEGCVYKEYCETFADVRKRLKHHAARMQGGGAVFNWVREPAQWFADAVKNSCFNRRQPYIVAKHAAGGRSEWLTVIALK